VFKTNKLIKPLFMKTIDLHTHTTVSDGTFSPIQLIDYAVKKNLSAVAITDHDTMDGIQEALNYIRKNQLPIELIPGMEVSSGSHAYPYGLHILAYYIDKNDLELEEIINSVHHEFQQGTVSPENAIKLITKRGGIPVLAHPKEYCLSMAKLDSLIGELAPLGLKGLECIYPTHSAEEIKQLKDITLKYDIQFTGGTDFHGSRKAYIDLGSGFGEMTIPYDIVNNLKNSILSTH
jgi:predicted metal-dependent phosphoesterase TrpH